ncbi:MAG: transcriptional repressor [Chitinophagaceae bacterium]|nr:transcriptional repressor [Chitinophagaceae bacterium]MCU0403208.1 transcriptional repressor [Chitinophagaceae bacterium]
MKDQATQLLRSINMSVTDSRRQILDLFLENKGGALKHADIEKRLDNLDRVTIYRTLIAFTEKGVIHSIPGSDGSAKYALCHGHCTDGHHHDNHVHFQCKACGSTQCLDDVMIPPVKLPPGFFSERIEMVITGFCDQCSPRLTEIAEKRYKVSPENN